MAYGDSSGILPPGSTVSASALTINGSVYDLEITPIKQPNPLNAAFAVTDANGVVAFGVSNTGSIIGMPALPPGSSQKGLDLYLPGNLVLPAGVMSDQQIIPLNPNNWLGLCYAICDQNYNVAWGIRNSGHVVDYSGSGSVAPSTGGGSTASLNQTANPMAPNVDTLTVFSLPDSGSVMQVNKSATTPASVYTSSGGNNFATITPGGQVVSALTADPANDSTQPSLNQDQSWINYVKTPHGGGAPAVMKMNRFGQHQMPAASPYENAYALSHVMISGQSLSIGQNTTGVLSITQPLSNLMFNGGMTQKPGNDGTAMVTPTSLVPLVEQANAALSSGETIASGFANTVAQWMYEAGIRMPLLMSGMGVGGTPYSGLRKGTIPYSNGQLQVATAKALAAAAGFATYGVRGLLIVHGEADASNTAYDANIAQWQRDFETDTKAVTGQLTDIPLILCQTSGAFNNLGSGFLPSSLYSPNLQWQASINNPGKILCTGPSYMCQYTSGGPHMTPLGYRKNAGYFAKAWLRGVFQNKPWRPLCPRAIVRDGLNVYVDFWVPVPPIQIDLTTVTEPHFAAGSKCGFEWFDSSSTPPAIAAVSIVGPTTLQIQLASVPTGGNMQLRYAYSFVPTTPAGPANGPRGNLRDSDPALNFYGDTLPNWCVHFSLAVN